MGLDWIGVAKLSRQDRIEKAKERGIELPEGVYLDHRELDDLSVPMYSYPCKKVKAPKVSDRATFREDMEAVYNEKMEEVAKEKLSDPERRNDDFIEYWEGMSVEKLMDDRNDSYDCENCPLLRSLRGADSTDSFFIGITVSTCSFRGKRISSDSKIPQRLTSKAYTDMLPDEMLEYASELMEWYKEEKDSELFIKDPYDTYLEAWYADPINKIFSGEPMTERAYEIAPHWREENILEAVRWLQVCAKKGVRMIASY